MQRLIILLLSLSGVLAIAGADTGGMDLPKTRLPAPDFSLDDGKDMISLSQYAGKLVLLNFWYLDCKPCRDEMASLDTLNRKYHKQGLRVLAISIADKQQRILQYVKDNHYSISFLVDTDRKLRSLYKVNAVPLTYLVGRDGKFIARFVGARDWSDGSLQSFIEAHLRDRVSDNQTK